MTIEPERVIGPRRAALLARSYQKRLQDEDLLEPAVALRVAVQTFALGNIYALASPGQEWEAQSRTTIPRKLVIERIEVSTLEGPMAVYHLETGEHGSIALNALDALYQLTSWPAETSEPD